MASKVRFSSRLYAFLDGISSLGLKVGIPIAIVAVGYFVSVLFGSRIKELDKLAAEDSAYFFNSLKVAATGLTAASAVVVISIIIRFYYEEFVGQSLSVFGALVYFGAPEAFGRFVNAPNQQAAWVVASIVREACLVGAICLVPGLVLVIRDCILRIWRGISVRRILESRWGDERERERRKKPKFYGKCWDMAYCREFVRQVCPAFKSKKACWRIKTGCYCDEHTILMAMAGKGNGNESYKGILHSLGIDGQSKKPKVSAKAKRMRCRRCGIYAEHQRQKYRLLSPMVFPAVIFAIYVFYGQITIYIQTALHSTDKFISFLSNKTVADYSFAADERMITILAVVWLGIIAISYALRTLEYMIFDLQV
ncbi:MAG: hypothetical protein ABFD49_02340 [Armatimonadota bacterium]|nr:hypothetical protein [bacterium]